MQQGYNDVVNTQTLDTSTLPMWFWYFAAGGVVAARPHVHRGPLRRELSHDHAIAPARAFRLVACITFALLSLLVTIVACAALTYAAFSGLAQYITPR